MARTKRNLLVLRHGELIADHTYPTAKQELAPKAKRPQVVTVKPRNTSIENPSRAKLTKAQWERRGDGIRVLKNLDYIGADSMSADHVADAVQSVHYCTDLRVMAQL